MTLGALGYVGYGVEETDGTFVTPTKFLPVSNFSFEDTNEFIVPDQIRRSRDRYIAMVGPYNVSGSAEMELIPTDVATLLRSAWAATVSSGAYSGGGYEHVYTPASEAPTLTFEAASGDDILILQYAGVRVNTLEIKAAFGEIVTATFGLEGIDRRKVEDPSTPVFTDVVPFHFTGADVKTGGAANANVKDFTFGTNQNLTRIGTLRRTRAWRAMRFGMREVTLGMTLDFQDGSEYDKFAAEEIFDVDLFMEGADGLSGMSSNAPILRIEIPNVRYNKVGSPLSAADYLEQATETLVIAPIGGDIFTATLVTNEATVA
jgi:hypothetical protein